MEGIRTNEHNKMQMAQAFGYMMDKKQVRVWDKFVSAGESQKAGDTNLWANFVEELGSFMEVTEAPKQEHGKPRTYLTGKNFGGGEDDLVMCALLYTAAAKAFTARRDIFIASNNPFNHTSLQGEERNYDQVRSFFQTMRQTPMIPLNHLLWTSNS